MKKTLPARPDLDQLKTQAKELLDAFRAGDEEAIRRVTDALPSVPEKLALHDAQSAIAREYGFASWNELKTHVEASAQVRALLLPHLAMPLPAEVERALVEAAARVPDAFELPAELPLLPVRNAVLTPGSVAPLNIGRPSSIAAIRAAGAGEKAIAIFSQREAVNEAPIAGDLHPVGVAARVVASVEGGEGQLWIVVRAHRWIRLQTLRAREPFLVARIRPFEVEEVDAKEAARLEAALRERVKAFAARLPDPERLLRMTSAMSAAQLADAAIANLPVSVDDKARYASEPSLVARLEWVLALFDRAA